MPIYPRKYRDAMLESVILDLFVNRDGELYWTAERPKSVGNRTRAPWGALAGGRDVWKHGRLVSVKGYALLTTDLLFALDHAGEYPWNWGVVHEVPNPRIDDLLVAAIHKRFTLNDAGQVVWAIDRSDKVQAGDLVIGSPMSGLRSNVVITGNCGYLVDDVKNYLQAR